MSQCSHKDFTMEGSHVKRKHKSTNLTLHFIERGMDSKKFSAGGKYRNLNTLSAILVKNIIVIMLNINIWIQFT